jgi:hypothetical protein
MGYTRTSHGTGIEVVEQIDDPKQSLEALLGMPEHSEDVLDQPDTISLSDHKEELSARRRAFLYE